MSHLLDLKQPPTSTAHTADLGSASEGEHMDRDGDGVGVRLGVRGQSYQRTEMRRWKHLHLFMLTSGIISEFFCWVELNLCHQLSEKLYIRCM